MPRTHGIPQTTPRHKTADPPPDSRQNTNTPTLSGWQQRFCRGTAPCATPMRHHHKTPVPDMCVCRSRRARANPPCPWLLRKAESCVGLALLTGSHGCLKSPSIERAHFCISHKIRPQLRAARGSTQPSSPSRLHPLNPLGPPITASPSCCVARTPPALYSTPSGSPEPRPPALQTAQRVTLYKRGGWYSVL